MRKKEKQIKAFLVLTVIIFMVIAYNNNKLLFIILLSIVILFIIFNMFLKTNKGKGWIGEFVVKKMLGKDNPKKDIYSVHNITFAITDRTVQIDHVLITKAGIFVVETKNYGGRIYGDEKSDNWTQVLAYGRHKNKVYNPFRQNYGHIKALEEKIGYSEKYKNIIVFTGRADVMNELKNLVCYPVQLKKLRKNKEQILTSIEVKDIYDKLTIIKNENTIKNKEHIINVQSIIDEKQNKLD